MTKVVLLLILTASPAVHASQNLYDIWRNNQATQHMQQKKMFEAYEEFNQLLSEQPFHPLFQYNMGASFVAVEEPQKAIKMYTELLKLNPLPPQVEFATLYNLGVLHSMKGGDIDQALAHYQKALGLNPEYKEIKTNIELLMKQNQGKGKGEGKDKNQQQNQEQKDSKGEQPKEPKEFTNKKQPNQFDSKDMSKGDVKKILEELKKQEQRIRAKHERKGGKEADREKAW